MKNYRKKLSKRRYTELKYICLAYPEKVKELEEFSYIASPSFENLGESKKNDTLERKVLKQIELRKQVEAIERTCVEIFGEDDYQEAMKNIVYGKSFNSLELYMSERKFYMMKTLFFQRLDEKI